VALGTECGWRWLTEVLELAERVRRARLAGMTWGGVGDGVWLEMVDGGPGAGRACEARQVGRDDLGWCWGRSMAGDG
jgi:hypothetical protein